MSAFSSHMVFSLLFYRIN